AVELGNRVALREPHARGLTGQMDRDGAADLAGGDVERAEAGHRLHGIAHRVGAELGPALAPEVLRHLRAVDDGQHLGELLRALRHAAVVLPHAEDVVAAAGALLHAALDLTRRPQRHADLGHDEPERALGAGDGGHARIGPAVLRGHDDAVGGQVAMATAPTNRIFLLTV